MKMTFLAGLTSEQVEAVTPSQAKTLQLYALIKESKGQTAAAA